MYSATSGGELFYRQLLWTAAGWAAFGLAFIVPYRAAVKWGFVLYLLALVFLGILAVKAVTRGGAAHRWLAIGPFSFQPSEVAKVAAALVLTLVTEYTRRPGGLVVHLIPVAVAALPAALTIVEPDLGTAALFLPLLIAALFWSGAPAIHIFLLLSPLAAVASSFRWAVFGGVLVAVGAAAWFARLRWWERVAVLGTNVAAGLAAPVFWGLLKEYQKARILAFLSPTADPRGAGYSIIQSIIALGSGQIFGKGFLGGSQVHLKFLPAAHTDFAFATWGEEFGFIGCAAVLILFGVLFGRAFLIAYRAADVRGGVLAFTLTSLLFVQFTVNVAMAVGLIPVVGVPLPFMSYGGSSLVTSWLALGLILNVKFRRRRVAEEMRLGRF